METLFFKKRKYLQGSKTEPMKLLADVGIVKIKGEKVCFPLEREGRLQQDVPYLHASLQYLFALETFSKNTIILVNLQARLVPHSSVPYRVQGRKNCVTSLKSVCVGGLFCVTRTAPRIKLIVNAYLLNTGSNKCIVVFLGKRYIESLSWCHDSVLPSSTGISQGV